MEVLVYAYLLQQVISVAYGDWTYFHPTSGNSFVSQAFYACI